MLPDYLNNVAEGMTAILSRPDNVAHPDVIGLREFLSRVWTILRLICIICDYLVTNITLRSIILWIIAEIDLRYGTRRLTEHG